MGNFFESSYTVGENDNGRRIDRIVRKMFPSLSLSAVYKMIRKGHINVSGKKTAIGIHVKTGDEILVHMKSAPPVARQSGIPTRERARESIQAMLVYENDLLLVLNKPRGMLVHGDDSASLLVEAYLSQSLPPSLSFVPGPVHRLDRNTSGLLVFAKTLLSAQSLSRVFRDRLVKKYYISVFSGTIEGATVWEDTLDRDSRTKVSTGAREEGGARARTDVFPLSHNRGMTLAICDISSGRTHQIRAQGAIHGHPLAGDVKYGGGHRHGGYILHAAGLRFPEDQSIGIESLVTEMPHSSFKQIEQTFGNAAIRDSYKIIRTKIGIKN